MTRLGHTQRLTRLEEAVDLRLPLYIQRWLGEPLTAEQTEAAEAEWEVIRALPDPDPSSLSSDAQEWLNTRDLASAH